MINTLTPKVVLIVQMALTTLIEDNDEIRKNSTIPFTPEARKDLNELNKTAKSALMKIQNASGHALQLDPYKPGDEEQFLTKQS